MMRVTVKSQYIVTKINTQQLRVELLKHFPNNDRRRVIMKNLKIAAVHLCL